jgi:hypothetical protein
MEESPRFDFIDILLGLGIFAGFVIFAVCMWLLRRELNKKKANQKDANK